MPKHRNNNDDHLMMMDHRWISMIDEYFMSVDAIINLFFHFYSQ